MTADSLWPTSFLGWSCLCLSLPALALAACMALMPRVQRRTQANDADELDGAGGSNDV